MASPMDTAHRRLSWRLLAVIGLMLCVAVFLLHASPAHNAPDFLLLPVVLFGLVLVPRSLWPVFDFDLRCNAPLLHGTTLFQRPPPSAKN